MLYHLNYSLSQSLTCSTVKKIFSLLLIGCLYATVSFGGGGSCTPPTAPAATDWANNQWVVHAYNSRDISTSTPSNYRGYYTQDLITGLGFNTAWSGNNSPSSVTSSSTNTAWVGCEVNASENTFIHKRRGFPCGTYRLTMQRRDNETRVFVNGINVTPAGMDTYNSYSGTPQTIGVYMLDHNSTIEVRTGGGGAPNNAELLIERYTNGIAVNNDFRTCRVTGNQWVDFFESNGRYIASIRGATAGTNLGDVTARVYVDGTVDLVPACADASYETAVMQRHWVIDPTTNGAAIVRLPYSNTEFHNLATASVTSSSPDDLVTYPNQGTVYISKYSGPNNVNANPDDNCPALGGSGGTTRHVNSGTGTTNPVAGVNAFYSDFSIPGFSEFWLHGNTVTTPLSVQLSDFNAHCDESGTRLNWTTASEQNSDYFTLEKSRDGDQWEQVTTIHGKGNSNTSNTYEFTDHAIAEVYYRLKLTDFDGKRTDLEIIHVNCTATKNQALIYPNPVTGVFSVRVTATETMKETAVFVRDVNNKIVASRTIDIAPGTNTIIFEGEDLSPGTYIVYIDGTEKNTFPPVRLVVQ